MEIKTVENNYAVAKMESDKVDDIIIQTIKEGFSFRVEAGAGSGKTYSLLKAIEWIQANRWNEYKRNKQNVACITYTNAAVDVIVERLSKDSFIIPSTIHSFAWNTIKHFQSTLVQIVKEDASFYPEEGDFSEIVEIQYTLGHRYKENGILYLFHEDVLRLFCILLDNAKFRKIFTDRYPMVLIDEYQDSYKPIIDRFIEYFISEDKGPQFGFFGDAWQTIYQFNKACGKVENDKIKVIQKGSNFRSAPKIVDFLNRIRPDLPQKSAIDDFDGEVVAVTCDDYAGSRRDDRAFKGDLPAEELRERLEKLIETLKQATPSIEKLKVLMITHKVLATQQGYEKLLGVLNDGLRDKQDPILLFFMNTVETVYKALCTSDMQMLFDAIGVKRYPITCKDDKAKWGALKQALGAARSKRAIDVIDVVDKSRLIPIPPQVESYIRMYHNAPETLYSSNTSIQGYLDLEYSQFLSAIDFLYPDAEYSTEHGVKGEEYDNVVFVISKGWNQYQFETYAPMIMGITPIPKGKEDSFERNRNLFYVCCSRPRKRLILFITVQVDASFRKFLTSVIEPDGIYTFARFINKYSTENEL